MLQALLDPILPIFAVLAAGFVLRRRQVVDAAHATEINRFVFYLSAPALVFAIFARAPLDDLDLPALASYFVAEIVIYGSVALLARRVFRLALAESLLLGMAAVFSNHVFFVRPIAILVHGETAALPIGGIIVVDVIAFCGTVFLVDAVTSSEKGWRSAARGLMRNPFVYAPVLGALAWWAGALVPSGFLTFADFAGAAAAPVSLFALGAVLAGIPLTPVGALVVIVIAAKLIAHPLLVAGGTLLLNGDPHWRNIAILVAAGPCGAMPFVIALQYGVEVRRIAIAVFYSTALSLLTLSFLI